MNSIRLLLFAITAWTAVAQQYEIGGLGGGAFLNSSPLKGPPTSVTAGFSPGPAVGVLFGHDLYSRWSGEIRYGFARKNSRLQSGSETVGFSGQAHTLQYEVVFHARAKTERFRPYVAAGAGIKIFRGTGEEAAYRPLMQFANLTRTQELKPMLILGGGLKMRLRHHLIARIDLSDQITRFPLKIITPAKGIELGGWLHDFVPSIGLGWMFE